MTCIIQSMSKRFILLIVVGLLISCSSATVRTGNKITPKITLSDYESEQFKREITGGLKKLINSEPDCKNKKLTWVGWNKKQFNTGTPEFSVYCGNKLYTFDLYEYLRK